ncbi:hypothetical protein DFH28DRAFT_608953 [Melampsora americana]|nr:hypothetical protein DFH28DRAFT_608953 [Melampsora americana]
MLTSLLIWPILIPHIRAFYFGNERYITDCEAENYQMANNNYQLCVDQWRAVKNHPYAPEGLRKKAEEAKEIAFEKLKQELATYRQVGNTDFDASKKPHPCLTPETYGQFINFKKSHDHESSSQKVAFRLSRGVPILRAKQEDGECVYTLDDGTVLSAQEWEKTRGYLKPDQPWKLAYNNYQHCLEHWNLIKADPSPPLNLLPEAEAAVEDAWENYMKLAGIRNKRPMVHWFGSVGHKASNTKVNVFRDVKQCCSRYRAMLRSASLPGKGRTKKPVLDK